MDGAWLCCAIPVIILIIIVVAQNDAAKKLAAARVAAKKRYDDALAALRSNPTDSALRADALEKGRRYLGLLRENRAITVYDEAKLKNDLDAACAAAPTIHEAAHPVVVAAPARPTVEDRLTSLNDLYQKGLITDEEYTSRRQQILSEL